MIVKRRLSENCDLIFQWYQDKNKDMLDLPLLIEDSHSRIFIACLNVYTVFIAENIKYFMFFPESVQNFNV